MNKETTTNTGRSSVPLDKIVMPDFEVVKAGILSNLDHSRFICGLNDKSSKLKFGDFVVSGINTLGTNVIGYVVQIRKKWGAFGSDMLFIRDQDGVLMTHENQSFWKLTEDQLEAVKPFFKNTPSEELDDNPKLEYSTLKGQFANGFIVDEKDAPARTDSCAFAITVAGA